MLLSGFTFIRNAIKYDFPITECVESMLPLVDELVINVGKSEDGTEELMTRLQKLSPKIKLLHSVWNDAQTDRGLVLSEQTNIALDACQGRWALYLQADEALHEAEHANIARAIREADREGDAIDGLRLRYLHFYGGYSLVQRPWNWYPSEIRIIRRASGARSYGDAQTFRIGTRELRTRLIDAHVFHYGHARMPEVMQNKIRYFHRFWHGDQHGIKVEHAYKLDWQNLVWFWGSHPKPYAERVKKGAEWSPRPTRLAPEGRPLEAVILTTPAQALVAGELGVMLSRAGTRVSLAASISDLHRAPRTATLVDLAAETRTWPGFIAFLTFALRFQRRVAHVPSGRLSPVRRRFYDFISWGCHETSDLGFRVPTDQATQARQLARWVGAID